MQNAAEIELAVSRGVAALGFVSEMPSGLGPVPEAVITDLVPRVPRHVRSFLLTCLTDADEQLLDSGRPRAKVKELGGTGRVHDWDVSRRIREAVAVPVWLAASTCAPA